MRYVIRSGLLFFLSVLLLVPISSWGHSVGESKLEGLPIWKECCHEQDCISQQVRILGKEGNEKISVRIEGVATSVTKGKFSPVPSAQTWVCYILRNGEINDDNIRCILYPQNGGIA
jgi:hypothetical protein